MAFSILKLAIAITSLLTLTSAACLPHDHNVNPTPSLPLSEIAAKNTAGALSTPTTYPVAIALGIGYQNYTCGSANTYLQTLAADGALAELYNIADILTTSNIDTVSPTALKTFEKCLSSPASNYQLCHLLAIESVRGAAGPAHIGQHFFSPVNGAQTPHFALDADGLYIGAKKSGAVAAPSNAYVGQNGLGAVPWLYLTNDGESYTNGLSALYRVETAGGVAPASCSTAGQTLSVPYTAQYWFYS